MYWRLSSRHRVHNKHNRTKFQISEECLPNQIHQPNKRSVNISSSTQWNPKEQNSTTQKWVLIFIYAQCTRIIKASLFPSLLFFFFFFVLLFIQWITPEHHKFLSFHSSLQPQVMPFRLSVKPYNLTYFPFFLYIHTYIHTYIYI